MKRKFKALFAILMAFTLLFAMSGSVFANETGTATMNVYICDTDGTPYLVDSAEVASGQSVYTAIRNTFDYYDQDFYFRTDVYDDSLTTFYLEAFVGYEPVNIASSVNADGSGSSRDWGWLYTVNGSMPAFPDNIEHRKAMNQYVIASGDEIDIAYTLTDTVWNANYDTVFTIIYPWN